MKVYDRFDCNFSYEIMDRLGLPVAWIKVVYVLYDLTSSQVLVGELVVISRLLDQ